MYEDSGDSTEIASGRNELLSGRSLSRTPRKMPSQYSSLQRSINSISSAQSASPSVDSSILESLTLEQRDKFTLYKVVVSDGERVPWVIYRRYQDFVLLNKKLGRLFPHFRLNLPPRRIFRDNFDKDFIERRQHGLEEFMRNVLGHRDLLQSPPVTKFFRFDNPPRPDESLEASQSYAQSLEVSLSSFRLQMREQNAELNSLKTELARVKYHKDENHDLASHFQKQHAFVEEATKALKEQLSISQENEARTKEELERLKEEIKAERASAQAGRVLERRNRELAMRNDMLHFRQSQDDVDSNVSGLVTAISQLPKVNVDVGGKKFELKAGDEMADHVHNLSKALKSSREQIQKIHRNALEMYRQETEDLKEELARCTFQVQSRILETDALKEQLCAQEVRFKEGLKAQDNYIKTLRHKYSDLQQYVTSTEEKYFYSLVIGVKLNMAVCGHRIDQINQLKPMALFERVRNHGIAIEHWPSWVSRELATASANSEDLQ
ncbi:sorting nexin-4 [Nematostella vectensis]|uniref:sorting nexin-4 n=1 Tax=Nematostella vectensis TaxID=45351 RepID=UPI00139000BA|nr:sorting nexin-4 [Nematostella vectensis]